MSYKYYIQGLIAFAFLLPAHAAFATPAISTVTAADPTLVNGTDVTLSGSGFGAKAKPMPVLFDVTDKAWENGVLNSYQAGFSEGQAVLPANQDPNTLWSRGSGNVVVTYKEQPRHSNSKSHYLAQGGVSFFGWPSAYGGQNTPSNNEKLYVSWWYKPYRHPRWYWKWELSNVKGNFIFGSTSRELGEELLIDSNRGQIRGEAIAISPSGELHFIAPGITSANDLLGKTIQGVSSGATAVLTNASTAYSSPGSSKFLRVWEEGSGNNGLRASWTQMHTTLIKSDGTTLNHWQGVDDMKVRDWNHMEFEIDLANNTMQSWLNNQPIVPSRDISIVLRNNSGFSPTIALIGTDGKQYLQSAEFGEIYMDSTLQRVAIGNAASWDKVSHSEIQLPDSWSGNSIRFKARLGALENVDPRTLYIYVFDENGVVNQNGASLCAGCKAPPDYPSFIQ